MVDTRSPVLVFRSPRPGASFEFWLSRKLRPATRRAVTAALVALLPREEVAVTASSRCRRHGPGLHRVRFAVRGPAERPRAQGFGHPQGPRILVSVFFAWAGAAPVILNGHAVATNALTTLRETHDPHGALVLFEHVHSMVESEAAMQGSAAVAELRDAEDRYRLGAALQAHRLAARATQRELAIRSGIPRHRISEIETGCANPTLSPLTALTRALGADLDVQRVTQGG